MNMQGAVLNFDIHKTAYSEQGDPDFVWPVPIDAFETVMEKLAAETAGWARYLHDQAVPGADVLAIMRHWILVEAVSLFNALQLKQGCAGRRAHFAAHHGLFREVYEGRRPKFPAIVPIMLKGPPPAARWKAPLRLVRDTIIRDGILRAPPARVDYSKDIVSTSVDPNTRAHAAAVGERVVYQRLETWYDAAPEHALQPAPERVAPWLVSGMTEIFHRTFETAGVALPTTEETYLGDFTTACLGLCAYHLDGILSRPHLIPARLWTATGGAVWSRILRWAVQQNGGTVTGHDHALGEGHIRCIDKSIVEMDICDRFMSTTKGQTEGLLRNFRPALVFQRKTPEVAPIFTGGGRISSAPLANGPVQSVMLVSTIYPGATMRYSRTMADVVAADWHARLLAWLHGQRFTTILKPHPGGLSQPPKALDQFCLRLTEPFESVMDRADVFIFDCHTSTTLRDAMLAGKSIVYVDFKLAPLFDDARDLLSRRCAMVNGWFDEQNRAQIDWAQLSDAIGRSVALRDCGFVERYLA